MLEFTFAGKNPPQLVLTSQGWKTLVTSRGSLHVHRSNPFASAMSCLVGTESPTCVATAAMPAPQCADASPKRRKRLSVATTPPRKPLQGNAAAKQVAAKIAYTAAPGKGERAGIVVSSAPKGGAKAFPLDPRTFRAQHGSVPLPPHVSETDAWRNVLAPVDTLVTDARGLGFSLDGAGFQLVDDPAGAPEAAGGGDAYYRLVEAAALRATGASRATAYCHARRSPRPGGAKSASAAGYAGYVHSDQSDTSWSADLERLDHLPPGVPEDTARAAAAGRRYAVLSAWRYVGPAETCLSSHLAVLDHASVTDPADVLPFSIVADGTFGGNYRLRADAAAAKRHRFYYYPAMTRDELLLFVVCDSAHPARATTFKHTPSVSVLHTAFADPTAPEGEPLRESIDVRVLLSWD